MTHIDSQEGRAELARVFGQSEVSMVDEILETPEGRAAMRMAEENSALLALLDKAKMMLIDASCLTSPMRDADWHRGYYEWMELYKEVIAKQ